jgi:hypothetical protein
VNFSFSIMLCDICTNLDIDLILRPSPNSQGRHDFHDGLEELHISAISGCEFCRLVDDEIRARYDLETLQKHFGKKVYIGLAFICLPWRSGNSTLWTWCGEKRLNSMFTHYSIIAEFNLCIPRSNQELETGLP